MPDTRRDAQRRQTGWLLLVLCGLATALLTFAPIGWGLNRLTVRIYVALIYGLHMQGVVPEHVGWLLNVVMFVPVGVALRLLWRTWPAIASAVVISALIETIQLIPAVHREASLADVIANSLGAVVGVALVVIGDHLRRRRSSAEPPTRSTHLG